LPSSSSTNFNLLGSDCAPSVAGDLGLSFGLWRTGLSDSFRVTEDDADVVGGGGFGLLSNDGDAVDNPEVETAAAEDEAAEDTSDGFLDFGFLRRSLVFEKDLNILPMRAVGGQGE
jgi:hypothetical protein